MKQFSKLYTVHTLVFLVLAGACFVSNFNFVDSACTTGEEGPTFKARMSSLVNKGLAYVYLICAGLSLVVAALSIYFGRGYLPPELGKLNRVHSILGVVQRFSWILIRILHTSLLLIIAIFTLFAMTPPKCVAGNSNATILVIQALVLLLIWII
jgi:hypothetical protein